VLKWNPTAAQDVADVHETADNSPLFVVGAGTRRSVHPDAAAVPASIDADTTTTAKKTTTRLITHPRRSV
jgi:hypothetical protein